MILKKQLQLSRALLPPKGGTGLRLMSTSKPGKGKLPAPAVSVKKPGTSAITKSHITINANRGKNLKLSLNSSPCATRGFLGLQFASLALYFAKRLPLLGMIGRILKYYLGKTSFWSLLVLSRKAFITINAVLGVFFVLKLTGMDITTVLSNYSLLGNTYLDILQGIIKNSFN